MIQVPFLPSFLNLPECIEDCIYAFADTTRADYDMVMHQLTRNFHQQTMVMNRLVCQCEEIFDQFDGTDFFMIRELSNLEFVYDRIIRSMWADRFVDVSHYEQEYRMVMHPFIMAGI